MSKNLNTCSTSIPQLNSPRGNENHSPQISLPLKKRRKPQISSIPGTSPREPNRYQVTFGGEVIATELTSDEAFQVAKELRSAKFSQKRVGGEG